jgi:predicted dehydrogenase
MNTAGPRTKPIEGEGGADWTELAVYGTRAGAEIHDKRLILRKGNTPKVIVKEIKAKRPKGKNNLVLQTEHFCDCLLNGKEVQNTAEQAVMLMQMLDAVRKSAETGRSVSMKQLVSV